jgi:hypothetical protein
MFNRNLPLAGELPTTSQLLRSTAIAAGGALVILVGFVMPAEYGVDPTGIGRLTGLQKMGEIKVSLAKEAEAEEAAVAAATSEPVTLSAPPAVLAPAAASATSQSPSTEIRRDTIVITLAPDQGKEIKVALRKGEDVRYIWSSDAGKANFDIHADSKPLNISYHGYGKGSSTREEGTLTAAFDGAHGWFWRNRSGAPLTLTLEVEGPYTDLKQY